MTYAIRRATRDDIDDLVQHTLDMAIETENRVLDGAALGRGMHVTFDQPNLADYYVATFEPGPSGDSDDAFVNGASPTGASDSDGGDSPVFPEPAVEVVEANHPSPSKPPQVVGFMMTTRDYKPRTATTVQLLQTVYVAPDHRRQGLFRRFYEHIKAEVEADPECEGIWLYVEEANASAIKAYQRMGMTREDKHMMRWSKCGF